MYIKTYTLFLSLSPSRIVISVLTTSALLYVLYSTKLVGATPKGIDYLLTKSLLQTSSALNMAIYLLLKAENAATNEEDKADRDDSLRSHPVLNSLQLLNGLEQKLADGVKPRLADLETQMTTLVKAARLADGNTQTEDSNDDDDDDDDDELESGNDEPMKDGIQAKPSRTDSPRAPIDDDDDDDDSDSDQDDSDEADRTVLNDARFAVRPNELAAEKAAQVTRNKTKKNRRQRRAAPSDFGDDDDEMVDSHRASKALASTINSIQQRSDTKQNRKKKHAATDVERLDQHEEDDGELRRGLEMMEAALGKEDNDDMDGKDRDNGDGGGIDDELDDGDDPTGSEFYSKIAMQSKTRKDVRKAFHTVAPKYPGMEDEVDGERAISKAILKNRGLVAHKAKINRNPRVKKREQYRKALIRRRGNVREVRTQEGHVYGGETTGIKSRLSRSRKIGTK